MKTLSSIAIVLFAASALAQQPQSKPVSASVESGDVLTLSSAWSQDNGWFYYQKDGHSCARVHMGETAIGGHRFAYASTYKHFGAKDDVKVRPFADINEALLFAEAECK